MGERFTDEARISRLEAEATTARLELAGFQARLAALQARTVSIAGRAAEAEAPRWRVEQASLSTRRRFVSRHVSKSP